MIVLYFYSIKVLLLQKSRIKAIIKNLIYFN